MKKIILLLLSAISISSSANNLHRSLLNSTDTSRPQKNLWTAHIVMKAFTTGDISMIDSIVAVDFVDHTGDGEIGRDSLKAMIMTMHKQYPDMKTEIIKEFADDEYVFLQTRTKGTGNGEMGMPKGPFEMKAIEVIRFKDAKIVEHWSYIELGEVMKMISALGSPGK